MLSIIIPAKNEPYLPVLLEKLAKIRDKEILIQTEEGLGNAVIQGIKKAKGDKIIVMDADGGHNPKYIPFFKKELEKHPMVIGSRYIDGGGDKRNLFRRIISRIITLIVRLKLNNGIKDPLSGYFGFRKEILNGVDLYCKGFKIGLEIIMKTGTKVKEIPIILERRKLGKSKANIKELINLVNLLCR